jgi:hypothetical protein
MKIRTLALAALAFASQSAMATTDLYWCDGCNEVLAAQQHGTGYQKYIFIGNLKNKTLHKYFTYWVQDESGQNPDCEDTGIKCGHFVTVNKTSSITSSEKKAFNSLVSFYYDAPVGWKKHKYLQIVNPVNPSMQVMAQLGVEKRTLSNGQLLNEDGNPYEVVTDYPNPNASVFDVINQGPVQNDMIGWAGTHYSSATFAELINDLGLFHVTNADAPPTVEWTIKFADKSMISITMDFKSSAHKWTIKPNSAFDARNNSIPRNMNEVAAGPVGSREIFDYTRPGPSGDLNRLLSQLRGMGVPVSGSTGAVLACVRTPSGVSCSRYLRIP